jgi:hypothetical protein
VFNSVPKGEETIMSMFRNVLKWVSVPALALALAPAVNAQATRTWVSGVGDDVNPCSRTAPCKTFAGAISKTAAGGEISALDPGGFGGVTITKAITINGSGTLASVLVSGTNGITVNAGVNDKVVLRNISIHGIGTGLSGVRYVAGREVVLENVMIQGFTTRGVDVALAVAGNTLTMKNVTISNVPTGVRLTTSAIGAVVGLLEDVSLNTLTTGIEVAAGGNAIVRNCQISRNTTGVLVNAATGNAIVENSVLSFNGTGATTSAAGGVLNLVNNGFYSNGNAVLIPGGTVGSSGDNRIVGPSAALPNTITLD